MSKITVEELDIIVQASVEQVLTEFKKIVPQLKKTMKQVEDNLNNIDAKGMTNKVQQAVQQVKQKINEVKNTGVDKQLQGKFDKAGASVQKYQGQLEQTQEKLRQVNAEMDNIQAKTWKAYTPEGIELGNSAIEPIVNNDLAGNKQYQNLSKQATKLEEQIQSINSKLNETKEQYNQIGGQIQQIYKKQSIWKSAVEKVKGTFSSFGNVTSKIKESFNQIPKITNQINTKIMQMGKGLKQGLGHILRYAGALFSLQTIYSTLSSSANAWLSSQNSAAQQLNANIEYMKYSMGSALAPIIEFIINLVYQLMKAIQSLVYALTGVNIFANASAKAYSSMANNAKKANKETKQLVGVHSEINNISNNDNNSTESSGTITPSFDLSEINPTNTILDAIKNGNWEEVGKTIGQKLNEAMTKINWTQIKEQAKNIGKNIALSINGFIEETDWSEIGNTLAQGVNTAFEGLHSFVITFNWEETGQALSDSINGFVNNVDWSLIGTTLSDTIKGLGTTIGTAFREIDWEGVVRSFEEVLGNIDWSGIAQIFFNNMGAGFGSGATIILTIISDAFSSVKKYFSEKIDEAGGNIVLGILKGIVDALIGIGQWIYENMLKPFVDGFKEAFGIHSPSTVFEEFGINIIEGLFNGIQSLIGSITEIWDNIKKTASEVFDSIKSKVTEIWSNIVNSTKEKWEDIKTKVKQGAEGAWKGITSIFGNVAGWFGEKFSKAWQAVKNVFSKGGEIFDGIKEGILNGLKSIVNAIIRGINKVISIPFNGINSALKAIRNVNIFGLQPFSWISTIRVPQIPELAKGGVLYDETIVQVAEYSNSYTNPEIVTPQNIMEETFDRVLARYQNSDNTSIYLTVNVGNNKLGQILLDDLRNMKRRSGKGIQALVGG